MCNRCLFRQNCNLGQHVPLEDGVGEGGIVLLSSQSDTTAGGSTTTDPNTDTRHCEYEGGGSSTG